MEYKFALNDAQLVHKVRKLTHDRKSSVRSLTLRSRSVLFRLTFFVIAVGLHTVSEDLKRMLANVKSHAFAHRVLLFLDFRVGKLKYLAALIANDVVMMFVAIDAFIVQVLMPKAVLADEVALDQQIERVIDRCAGDVVIFLFEFNEEFVGIEVSSSRINFAQHNVALRRSAVAFLFEELTKNMLDAFAFFNIACRCIGASVLFFFHLSFRGNFHDIFQLINIEEYGLTQSYT